MSSRQISIPHTIWDDIQIEGVEVNEVENAMEVESIEGKQPRDELVLMVGSLKRMVLVNNLLLQGHFPFSSSLMIKEGADFMKSLYENLLQRILIHEDADLIPEILEMKENLKK